MTIHDVVEINQRLFIVMRLVDGPSLDRVLAERGGLPWAESLKIVTAVAS